MGKINITTSMNRTEFLDLIKIIKMLYGRDIAIELFEKNIETFYDVTSESLNKKEKENK